MAGEGKLLAQVRPANTTAATAYTRPTNGKTKIEKIVIGNTTGSAATFRLFIDDDGTTYDQSTALYYDKSLAANDSLLVEGPFYLFTAGGTVGVRTGTGNALTFTLFGEADLD